MLMRKKFIIIESNEINEKSIRSMKIWLMLDIGVLT